LSLRDGLFALLFLQALERAELRLRVVAAGKLLISAAKLIVSFGDIRRVFHNAFEFGNTLLRAPSV
jgi:hypothetical protein